MPKAKERCNLCSVFSIKVIARTAVVAVTTIATAIVTVATAIAVTIRERRATCLLQEENRVAVR